MRLHYLQGWLEYRLAPGDTCEIVAINVEGDYRRSGIATQLLRQLKDVVPYSTVYAFSRFENEGGFKWYEAMGFNHVLIPNFYGFEQHAYMHILEVSGTGNASI